ncbi:hypothetical protein MNBD_GAMMA18-1453 [hydrothermal vent metagenome]|uniref:DUF4124 domain-containing protein n=1 Tax=hydrothermal vent metagenome TaxID=652676 RepID=A0A3B0ZIK6_9ZZZZ
MLLLLALPCGAEMYKWVDDDGNVSYGDYPAPDQEKQVIKPIPISTYSSSYRKPDTKLATKQAKKAKETRYTQLTIAQPQDDAAIRSNNGQLTVTLVVTPPLDTKAGHKIELILDGSKIATSDGSSITLANLNRGTHSLEAKIINKKGEMLIASPSQTFHLLRSTAQ